MIDMNNLKERSQYLNKLIACQDTEPVKVITGIRRCGKSSLLKLMVKHLKDEGKADNQIIEINFESFAFKDFSATQLYRYIQERIVPDKKMYLFFWSPLCCIRECPRLPSASIRHIFFKKLEKY